MTGLVEFTVADPDTAAARSCLRSYFAELDARIDGGFDISAELAAAAEYAPPAGLLLIAWIGGEPAGCGALRFVAGEPDQIKRMWIAPSARGAGLGRRLLAELERLIRERGGTVARLETNQRLTEAISLYRSAGYAEVAAYNGERYAHHWFEKRLG